MQRINSPVEVLCNWPDVATAQPKECGRPVSIEISRKIYVFYHLKGLLRPARGEGLPDVQPKLFNDSLKAHLWA